MIHQPLFNAIMDSAILLDKAGRIVYWNTGASATFGYSHKEVNGKSINLIYPQHYPFPKMIHSLHTHQKKWVEETIFIRKNGIQGHCRSHLSPILLPEENKMMALLMHHNVSEMKRSYNQLQMQTQHISEIFLQSSYLLLEMHNHLEQMEKKLRESELHFHLLAENATDIISRHAADGTYLYVSPSCYSALGYRAEDLINRCIYKYIHHDDQVKLKKAFTKQYDKLKNKPIIYRVKRKEGDFRWFESNVRLVIDEETAAINEIQLASRDITTRIMDNKARLRGQQLAHVFRLSTMEEMASGIAHEISQPLSAIINYTRGCVHRLSNNQYDQEQLHQIMEKTVIQAERAGEIVQRLKNFFCKGQLVKTNCKINSLIRETASLMKNELIQSRIKIDFNFDKNIPIIVIDKIQIQQVLLNLIQNAIESMHESHPKDKRIHIQTAYTHAKMVEVTLKDTGVGFSKDIVHKVFMPFFTTKAHGRGMGLAICRSIIETHGGQFNIHPNTTHDSWIRFTLPILTTKE